MIYPTATAVALIIVQNDHLRIGHSLTQRIPLSAKLVKNDDDTYISLSLSLFWLLTATYAGRFDAQVPG